MRLLSKPQYSIKGDAPLCCLLVAPGARLSPGVLRPVGPPETQWLLVAPGGSRRPSQSWRPVSVLLLSPVSVPLLSPASVLASCVLSGLLKRSGSWRLQVAPGARRGPTRLNPIAPPGIPGVPRSPGNPIFTDLPAAFPCVTSATSTRPYGRAYSRS